MGVIIEFEKQFRKFEFEDKDTVRDVTNKAKKHFKVKGDYDLRLAQSGSILPQLSKAKELLYPGDILTMKPVK